MGEKMNKWLMMLWLLLHLLRLPLSIAQLSIAQLSIAQLDHESWGGHHRLTLGYTAKHRCMIAI